MQPAVQEDGAPEKWSICHTHNGTLSTAHMGPFQAAVPELQIVTLLDTWRGPERGVFPPVFIYLFVSVIRMNIAVFKGTCCLGTPLITFEQIGRIL